MPHPNRVHPDGRFRADPEPGTLMGNRGILLDDRGEALPKRWAHKAWVCCALEFGGRHRKLRQPGRYTELFFLDEAVALAAGHRPCGTCRRAAFARWRALWDEVHGVAAVPAMDAVLHEARAEPGGRRMRRGRTDDVGALPDGAFAVWDGAPHLVHGGALRRFAAGGYGAPRPLPHGPAEVLTPAPTLALLRAGYAPALHPSAA
ncbi:hypothetical protein [Jannaschia sp. W003]|uniref:hypothetical protein n=1 Tax=Jannaschia sp. W003 TaxID=2867012 RepID=UPI0021A47937|nr:hypothetical protein [Jannaschia sp. W003]UWQ22854.1 hypothetical protein K3554_07475 [Jannaschia sp. W003]